MLPVSFTHLNSVMETLIIPKHCKPPMAMVILVFTVNIFFSTLAPIEAIDAFSIAIPVTYRLIHDNSNTVGKSCISNDSCPGANEYCEAFNWIVSCFSSLHS